jgi:hypothetical protein
VGQVDKGSETIVVVHACNQPWGGCKAGGSRT